MDDHQPQSISRRVAETLSLSPDAGAVAYEGAWTSWAALADGARKIEAVLCAAGVPRSAPVGWMARKSPTAVAAFASLLLSGRPIAPLRPTQSLVGLQDEIRAQALQAIVADELDWALEGVQAAARQAGSLGVTVSGRQAFQAGLQPGLECIGPGPHRPDAPGMVVERVSSGTTGLPKRIPVSSEALVLALRSAEVAASSGRAQAPLRMKTSPAVIVAPFGHASGVFALLFALYQARPIIVLDRFTVDGWVDAVRRHKPRSASLVPTMIRMVLEADVPPHALSSLSAIHCGTASLDPEEQDAFESRFGVPILIDYGAAEFIGGVAGWSLADHRRFGDAKRGSAGRPRLDVLVRTVDPQTSAVLSPGEIGLLEIRAKRFGPAWIRTTDLASLDEDGFLYIHGRADDAINRGGFKILPDEVAAVLRLHPGVGDAAVVGIPDPRLGQVPIALIEALGAPVDSAVLESFARERLAAYQVPVEFRFVDVLPRTTTLKVSRPELKSLLGI